MKKSDLDIQNENALLMAIAIADGYFPVNKKEYSKEFNKRMHDCGIKDYKEAFNFVYAGMPQYVGDDAIYSGKISLVNSNNESIEFALGNNIQTIDDYLNIPQKIIGEFANKYLEDEDLDLEEITKNKKNLYSFFTRYVAPNVLKERMQIRRNEESNNNIKNFMDKNVIDTLFDYKFSAFEHYDHCRGNLDLKYYSLTHGMIDAVLDFYKSVETALDERDLDIRAISPYPNEELGIDLPENFEL